MSRTHIYFFFHFYFYFHCLSAANSPLWMLHLGHVSFSLLILEAAEKNVECMIFWPRCDDDEKMSPCCLISYNTDLGEACIEILDVLSPVPALPKLLLTRAHHLTIRNGLVIWTRSNGAPWVLLWRLGPFYDQRSPSEGIFTYLPYIFH